VYSTSAAISSPSSIIASSSCEYVAEEPIPGGVDRMTSIALDAISVSTPRALFTPEAISDSSSSSCCCISGMSSGGCMSISGVGAGFEIVCRFRTALAGASLSLPSIKIGLDNDIPVFCGVH
jgi:hypothetical protein